MSWADFARAEPELAAEGRRLFYQYGVGLGSLATVGRSGPRLHPICPIVLEDGLYAFIVESPKQQDLRRDGRYALHAFLPVEVDDEFMVAGTVRPVEDPGMRGRAVAAYHTPVPDDQHLFEFGVERVLHAKYHFRGEWPPAYRRWRAPSP